MPSNVIYKIQLSEPGYMKEIDMPDDAAVVHVGLDPQMEPCLWYRFNQTRGDETKKRVKLTLIGTGMPFPAEYATLGSIVEGRFVWHLVTDAAWLTENA